MFVIDPHSGIAPFQQLRTQLIDAIADGSLPAGHKLPAVRTLAGTLDLAPGTVARAYKELEADGFVKTLGRNGTIVAPQGDPRRQQAQLAAAAFAEQIRALQVDPADALELARQALHA